ncbi:MAG TPA: ABC transporter substrate-binding protein [Verrucomicrobiae bacterium]|jgi:phospholipid transport system substrate-binding protein|nr:ABC transporter substrate-binding protein [Verrucomicrobiae bacterium]
MSALKSFLVLLFAGFIAASPGAAAADAPSDFITTLGTRAITELADEEISQADREARFRTLLNEHFDVPAIGRFVLGRHWKAASDTERTEFLKLFEDFIVRSYAARFAGYSGETFSVKGSTPGPKSATVVHSKVLRGSAEPIRLDWRVEPRGDKLVITDVIVEGVSMSVTQRSEFASVIQSSGGKIEGLLEALRNKTITADTTGAQ